MIYIEKFMVEILAGKIHVQLQKIILQTICDHVLNIQRKGLRYDNCTMEKGFSS